MIQINMQIVMQAYQCPPSGRSAIEGVGIVVRRPIGIVKPISEAAMALPTRPANLDRDHPVYLPAGQTISEPAQPAHVSPTVIDGAASEASGPHPDR